MDGYVNKDGCTFTADIEVNLADDCMPVSEITVGVIGQQAGI